eukprot:TRINITY_DN24487_c0_g1_i1.p1 TRINITY_DN24487_c0_g1~~TRINITY_DN24487_c0_g1_i1.p1  ORF type:complete len:193 (-),score=33.93 TRINITY_DN24487_c0_g1_i1:51-551(-)
MCLVGKHIWACFQDRKLRVWDTKSYEMVKEMETEHTSHLSGLCFVQSSNESGKGNIWCTSHDKVISVWSSETFECVAKLSGYHTKTITGATRMGDHVWSYGWDSVIHVWHTETLQHVAELKTYSSQAISELVTDYFPGAHSWRAYAVSYDHSCIVWRCRPHTHPPS